MRDTAQTVEEGDADGVCGSFFLFRGSKGRTINLSVLEIYSLRGLVV
ncbi:MAG: hypothetical protein ACXV5F_02250 [Halobacteriota archaeon]